MDLRISIDAKGEMLRIVDAQTGEPIPISLYSVTMKRDFGGGLDGLVLDVCLQKVNRDQGMSVEVVHECEAFSG